MKHNNESGVRNASPIRRALSRLLRKRRERKVAEANNIVCDEGHLGGYVRASDSGAPSGLDVSHGDPATWTPALWSWLVNDIGVRSMLDVGCGEGHCAAYFQQLGCAVRGVDGSPSARANSRIPNDHVVHDFARGAYEPGRTFDLVWSCEFVEHVHERHSGNFLRTFQSASRLLLMTYAPPGQPGWHHVNCQPAEYWIERAAQHGFAFDQPLTRAARQHCDAGHFRSKGLVFRPQISPAARH